MFRLQLSVHRFMLTVLVDADFRQADVFTKKPEERLTRLSAVLDKINERYGHDKLPLTCQSTTLAWPMKPTYFTPLDRKQITFVAGFLPSG